MKTHLVVNGLLIIKNKVLLIHHKKSGLWLPPGGHIGENETPDDALKREFMEEVNIEIEILNKNDVCGGKFLLRQLAVPFHVNVHNVGDHNHCCFYYLCTSTNKIIKIKKSELDDFDWFSIEDLHQEKIREDIKNIALKAFDLYKEIGRIYHLSNPLTWTAISLSM
jgi:8-oxo-dGTP pyrophosphatase MutT (NUDIX family)